MSGTKSDICVCLTNSANNDEEVCPISYSRPIYPWKPRKNRPDRGRGRGRGRCTDASGAVVPCADAGDNCFDANGVRIPGCIGGRGRGRGGGSGSGDGVYRYDYDDYDIQVNTPRGGVDDGLRTRCTDKNGIVVDCDSLDGREVVTLR